MIHATAPTHAVLFIGSEVFAMDKRSFQNETAFQVAMHRLNNCCQQNKKGTPHNL